MAEDEQACVVSEWAEYVECVKEKIYVEEKCMDMSCSTMKAAVMG